MSVRECDEWEDVSSRKLSYDYVQPSIIIIIVIVTSNMIIIGFVIASPMANKTHYDEFALIKTCRVATPSLFIFYTFIHNVLYMFVGLYVSNKIPFFESM